MKQKCNLIFLLLSSLLYFLSFPSFVFSKGLGLLIFFAYIPLFFLIYNSSIKFSFLYGVAFSLISYGLMGSWLINYSLFCYISVLLLFSVLYGLLFLVMKALFMLFGNKSWLVYPFVLTVFDWLKTIGPFGFSYGVSGYALASLTGLMRIASFVGVFGVSFFIYVFASLSVALILNILKKKEIIKLEMGTSIAHGYSSLDFHTQILKKKKGARFVYGSVLWAVFIVFTVVIFAIPLCDEQGLDTRKITAIQTNQDPWISGIEASKKDVETLIFLTKESLENEPCDIVVWPETAVVPSIMKNYYERNDIQRTVLVDKLLLFIEEMDTKLLTGNFHSVKNGQTYDDYNSALYFVPGKNVYPPKPEVYSKIKLVPFSETIPFPKVFQSLVMENNFANIHIWKEGDDFKVFHDGDFAFSAPICFEDNFGFLCRKFVLNGARAFISLSNDSWAESLAAQYHHLYMAMFRSAENHVPQFRSTVSGQTVLIDSNGKIVKELLPFMNGWLTGDIAVLPQDMKLTFYTLYGDVFVLFAAIILCFMLIIQSITVIIKKIKEN